MILTYEMLYSAWKKTVVQSSEENNRCKFKYNLEENLLAIKNDWEEGTFTPTPLRLKTIYQPKKRVVQVPSLRDKIIQHAMCDNYLYDALTKPIIKEVSACMVDRGDVYASKIVKEQLHRFYRESGTNLFYVLKCDIHSYFAEIEHKQLKDRVIDRYVLDEDVKYNLIKFLNLTDKGLPLGLQQSQLMANLNLSELDHKIKEVLRCKYYGRYMDDFYLISDNEEYLKFCWEYIKDYLSTIGLELNPKTAILKGKLDFLGFNYKITETGKVIQRVRSDKKRTKHRHIKLQLKELESGVISAESFVQSYQSYRAHLMQGTTSKLLFEWDNWIRGELNKIGYQILITERTVKLCQLHC